MNTKKPNQNELPVINEDSMEVLKKWSTVKTELERIKSEELELRNVIKSLFFTGVELKEGVNSVIAANAEVKITHKINRTIDEAALDSVMEQMPEALQVLGTLVDFKPTFSLGVYRELDEEVCKVFDQALTIKEGTPSLEVVLREVGDPALDPVTTPPSADWPAKKGAKVTPPTKTKTPSKTKTLSKTKTQSKTKTAKGKK